MFGPDRNTENMMEMWADLLSQIENDERGSRWSRTQPRIGTIEEREDCIVLTADLPGVEKKDIELSVHTESVSFKASTEDRDYDFGQSFDFELNPDKVKATFNNGVLDVTIHKVAPSKGKIIKIK
jgi:HSP20 family protein